MPIELKLSPELTKSLDGGALDGDEVWVEFLCQTDENGEHDPNEPPDDKVRPSHAAFHGQLFPVGEAPVPPLDYGCRCAIRYVAKPNSEAAAVLQVEAPRDETTTPKDATTGWLDKNVPNWGQLKEVAESSTPSEAIGNVQAKAKELGIEKPRAIAEMVVDSGKPGTGTPPVVATPPPAPPVPPTPVPEPPPPVSVDPEERIRQLEEQIRAEEELVEKIDRLLRQEDAARFRSDLVAVARIQAKLKALVSLQKGKK